jgi:hypothetical protein
MTLKRLPYSLKDRVLGGKVEPKTEKKEVKKSKKDNKK